MQSGDESVHFLTAEIVRGNLYRLSLAFGDKLERKRDRGTTRLGRIEALPASFDDPGQHLAISVLGDTASPPQIAGQLQDSGIKGGVQVLIFLIHSEAGS